MAIDLAAFRSNLIYEGSASPAELREDLERIRELDKTSEGKRRVFGWTGFLSLVGAVVSFFALSDSESIAVSGGLTALGVVLLVMYWRWGRTDVENRRYELLGGVLGLLDADLQPGTPVVVRMDLRKVDDTSKLEERIDLGNAKIENFRDPWLAVSGRFADGTSFSLSQTERFQRKRTTKTNMRGKTKVKTKTKSAWESALGLRFKEKRYGHVAKVGPEGGQGAVQLPRDVTCKRFRLAADSMQLRVASKSAWDAAAPGAEHADIDGPSVMAMMLLSCYQILNLGKA